MPLSLTAAAALLFCGMSCGIGAMTFALSWCAWTRRRDGLAKPGSTWHCRAAQSALFAAAATLLWWAAPALLVAYALYRWRAARRSAKSAPVRRYNLSDILATERARFT